MDINHISFGEFAEDGQKYLPMSIGLNGSFFPPKIYQGGEKYSLPISPNVKVK
jgi:hypothetical protein